MSKNKIVIIGGSGSIGSSIAKEVTKEGFEPYLIGRNSYTLSKVSKKLGCEFAKADVTNTDELKKTLENCGDNIFGLAYCAGSIDLKSLSLVHENDYLEIAINRGANESGGGAQKLFGLNKNDIIRIEFTPQGSRETIDSFFT